MITVFHNGEVRVKTEIGKQTIAIVNGILYDDLLTACTFDPLPCGHVKVRVIICGAEVYEGFEKGHQP